MNPPHPYDLVIGPLAQRLDAKMGGNKFKANTVLAIKLARAVCLPRICSKQVMIFVQCRNCLVTRT